jgi:hypothetical protein
MLSCLLINKEAQASRPHLQSILAGRMPALPLTRKASNYLTSPHGCLTLGLCLKIIAFDLPDEYAQNYSDHPTFFPLCWVINLKSRNDKTEFNSDP